MKLNKRNMIGVSLIEVILVLAIASVILVLGLRQYQAFNIDAAAQRIRYNVEEIIHGAAYYYYANCENSSGNTATLDPANSPANPYTGVTVNTLVTSGYLANLPVGNPLINSSGTGNGYLLQFNESTAVRNYCTTDGTTVTCSPIGYNIIWTIEVSVLLNDTSKAAQYFGMTGADCLTTIRGNNEVAPCAFASTFATLCQSYRNVPPSFPTYASSQVLADSLKCPPSGGTYNNYLSWERLPSMASPKGASPLWMTNPVVRQFKQMNEEPSLSYMLANPTVTNFKCGS
jgi:type II secretory pathway pseudopilin PulG